MTIGSHLERVRDAVRQSAIRAGRSPDAVALMAVSKTHPAAAVREAYEAGQRLFGENRVQEAEAKFATLHDLHDLETHLIGPLQSNKSARAAGMFSAVETVDSERIARRLNTHAEAASRVVEVFVEVKTSTEEAKHGCSADDLGAVLEAIAACSNLRLRGLMTVPEYTTDPDASRPAFAALRRLREQHVQMYPALTELSMGMSHDFAAAIAEGSTLVRVGTAIFGAREG